jgi:thiol-disulfide isomerase/thioredoxin
MTIEQLKDKISTTNALLLYFSGEGCGVCQVLQPKIKDAFEMNFPKIEHIYIDAKENPKISASFGVFSLPTIIVYFDGKEFLNKSRLISVDETINTLTRPYNLFYN